MDLPGEPAVEEKRSASRRRVLKSAQIIFNSGHSLIDCVIEDLSLRGARVRFAAPQSLPESLTLRFEDGRACVAERVWSRGNRAGLRFADAIGADRAGPASGDVLTVMLIERLKQIETQLVELRREIEANSGG